MTEAGWMRCTDPVAMVQHVGGRLSERKMRLVVVGHCRRNPVSIRESGKVAVDVAERFADGLATPTELQQARWKADMEAVYQDMLHQQLQAESSNPGLSMAQAEWLDQDLESQSWQLGAAMMAHMSTLSRWGNEDIALLAQTGCHLIRDVVGNPFRRAVIDPAWLSWNDGTIRKLAQTIYDARAFDRLPLLADALEDAGCTDADILGHCRGGGEHVRGCWVIDALLGKS